MKQITIAMKLVKSTKGTHVYGDSNIDSPVPTIYIKRGFLPDTPPDEIEIVIRDKN